MSNGLKLLFLIVVILSLECGIATESVMDDLNHPVISGTCDLKDLCIEFIGYNYENDFVGYNIYVSSEFTQTELRRKIEEHVNQADRSINTEIEEEFLLSRTVGIDDYPTITLDDIVNGRTDEDFSVVLLEENIDIVGGFLKRPIRVQFGFTREPNGEFVTSADYTVGITAYNSINHIESQPALIEGVVK